MKYDKMELIKPYYRKGNKYFYKKGRQRMTITRSEVGSYLFEGDVIVGNIQLPIITNDANIPDAKVEIRVYN